jgi:alpha-N-acetylglucosamine transferase
MFSRHFYSPFRPSENAEAPTNSKARLLLSSWLALRRVRTVLFCGLLILLLSIILLQYPDLDERIRGLARPNETVPMTVPCNCSAIESDDRSTGSDSESSIRWSEFAYVQYVTNAEYLCNSLMIFEALRRHNTKADLLMMHPNQWREHSEITASTPYESKLLLQARDQYKVNLVPIQVKTFLDGDDPTWQDSYTKLLAFNQTQYKRLVSLDSDATVLDV